MRVTAFMVSALAALFFVFPREAQTRHEKNATPEGQQNSSQPTATNPDPKDSAKPARSFRNCAEVRAAGVAPIKAGEPGYATHLDRDGDGVACEPYRRRQ
jgi:hypothetical protein